MLDDGKTYAVRALKVCVVEAKSVESEIVAAVLEVVRGPREGEQITWYGSLGSQLSIEITVRGLRALGWRGDQISTIYALPSLGRIVGAAVKHETYKGKPRARVSSLFVLPVDSIQAISGDRLDRLDAALRAHVREVSRPSDLEGEDDLPRDDGGNDGPDDPQGDAWRDR